MRQIKSAAELMEAEHVVSLCSSPHTGSVIALTSAGRMFERMRDTRDFATGPHHSAKWIWREIDGPLTQAGPS